MKGDKADDILESFISEHGHKSIRSALHMALARMRIAEKKLKESQAEVQLLKSKLMKTFCYNCTSRGSCYLDMSGFFDWDELDN